MDSRDDSPHGISIPPQGGAPLETAVATLLEDTEARAIASGDRTPLEKFFLRRMQGAQLEHAYLHAYGNADNLTIPQLRRKAAKVEAGQDFQELRANISPTVAARLQEVGVKLISMLENLILLPIGKASEEAAAEIADMSDAEKTTLLCAYLTDAKAQRTLSDVKDLKVASDILRSLREALGLSDKGGNRQQSITIQMLTVEDRRRKHTATIPTDGDEWRYEKSKKRAIHQPSYDAGMEEGRAQMGGDGCRCPGNRQMGGDGSQCYWESLYNSGGAGE